MRIRFTYILFVTLIACTFPTTKAHSALPPSNKPGMELFFYINESPTPFIVVEKKTQNLMLFEQGKALRLIKTFTCATGENPGTKEVSGDAKTPEGVYFITEVFQDNEITVFGSRAFHLDYPNVFDEYDGNNGDGIFIHGTNKKLIPYSTNGCITLDNDDLEKLAPYLTVRTIPVIVVESLEEELIHKNFAISYGDPEFTSVLETLDLSTHDIKPEQIEKLQFFKVGSQARAWIRYNEYDANSMQYKYDKQVFLKPSPSKNWRTLFSTHKQDKIPSLLAIYPVKNNQSIVKEKIIPFKPQPLSIAKGGEILDFVEKWRKSWTGKDIETYMNCYSVNFHSSGLGKKGWRQKKTYLNQKYDFIQVTIDNIVVEKTNKKAKISFFQTYQSDLYQTSGTKHLQLVLDDGKWMIEKEYM
ncbi:MAG: murein L,D-transpeptidase YafK [Desulforhopalus sp.]|jgi:murein L,D-transpeptidase YafK